MLGLCLARRIRFTCIDADGVIGPEEPTVRVWTDHEIRRIIELDRR